MTEEVPVGPVGRVVLPVLAVALGLTGCSGSPAAPDGASSVGPRPSSAPSPSASSAPSSPAPTTSAPSSSAPPSSSPSPDCVQRTLAELTPAERVGRLFMVGVPVDGASPDLLGELSGQGIDAVVLMGTTESGRDAVAAVTRDLRAGLGGGTLVAVDQEGGEVRRLRGPGFAPMPSAQEQAGWSDERLRARARTWGRELRSAGVDVDLAPVADVVPVTVGLANAPIAQPGRGYGSDPSAVARKVTAFVAGLRASDVQATLKHFPGLGRVEGNTDFTGDVVDDRTRRGDPLLAPFAAGVRAGAGWLMVSSAKYPRIDPRRLAVFSPTVVDGLVRRDLGFDGVVVSDDIGAAEALADVPPGERATRFLRAGGDVALTVDPGVVAEMVDATLDLADRDRQFARAVDGKVARVLRAQQDAGRLACGR